jgi:hypothetical protein
MSQNDFNIANQGFPATRADINSALQALASTSAGTTEPGTIYAYQMWYDETADLLKMRNGDNDAWITLAAFDQATDEWEIRTAVIQAVDSAGVVIKTDDGVARISVADSGAVTIGSVDINGGTIDGTVIGGSTAAAGSFTTLDASGDVNFDSGTLFVDVSENRVGINTTSPARNLVVNDSSNFTVLQLTNSTTGSASTDGFQLQVSDNDCLLVNREAGFMEFRTSNSTRMRITASGDLLVGKTTENSTTVGVQARPDGLFAAVRSGEVSGIFGRTTSDGEIVLFRKDSTAVGSIGAEGGKPYFSNGGNFAIRLGSNALLPANPNGSTSDNAEDLGALSVRWDDVYATNGTIQTSDRNEKQDIEELTEAERRVAVAAKGLMRKFRWKDAVEEKGDDARIHFGIIAQDLQAAFEAEGLDAGRYAMFIHSTWTDEETGEEKSRMGVRYPQLLAFIIAAI